MISNIDQKALQLLDNYNHLITSDLHRYNFCPELLGITKLQHLHESRLLCQTRGIYFLLDYAKLTNKQSAATAALNLYDIINEKYYDKVSHDWLQYPGKAATQPDIALYSYAFLLTALAKLYTLSADEIIKAQIYRVSEIVSQRYYIPGNKFLPLNKTELGVSQNALMHLFEAYLEAYLALNENLFCTKLCTLANEIFALFYDNKIGLVKEYSQSDLFEPGHSFEWASLLYEASAVSPDIKFAIDHSQLAEVAEQLGVLNQAIVVPEITYTPGNPEVRFRIWPTLERLRYYAMLNNKTYVNNTFSRFVSKFFTLNGLPVEYIDCLFSPAQTQVKSTTGYHLINCFKYLV